MPLRPPRDAAMSSTISQDFDKNMHDDNNDHNISTQAFVPQFQNNSFHKMLYDELAPEDDSIKQLEQSLRSTNTVIY